MAEGVVTPTVSEDGLPDRPYCTLADGFRFVSRITGQSKPTYYRDVHVGQYDKVIRRVAGRDWMSTDALREMYKEVGVA